MKFYIYFQGCSNNGNWIDAENLKSEKWIYALKNGINSISRIMGSKKGFR